MDLMLASVHHQDMEHLSNSQRIRAIAALTVTVFFWGAAFIAIRAVVVSGALSPGQLSFARLTLAAVVLGVIVAIRGGVAMPQGRDWVPFVALGGIGQAAYHLLLNAGERTVDGGTASLLVQVAPMIAAVSAVFFLGERLTVAGWIGSAIAFAGACVIAFAPGASGGSAQGLALVALSTLLWAAYLVIQKSIAHRYDPLALTAWPMWVGALALLPFSGGTVHALSVAPPSVYVALAALGLGSSVVGFMTWAYAIRRLQVTVAVSALYTIPVAAFLLGVVLLHEFPTLGALVGGGITIAGVALVQLVGKPRLASARSDAAPIEDGVPAVERGAAPEASVS